MKKLVIFYMLISSIFLFAGINDDLVFAAQKGDLSKVKECLKNGADINAAVMIKDYDSTALIEASAAGNKETVAYLISMKADVNKNASDGYTALMVAAGAGHKDIIELLLNNKADINAKSKVGFTALMRAAYKEKTDVVRYLLDKGAEVNIVSSDNGTALSGACLKNNYAIVKLLLEKGANPDDKIYGNDVLKVVKNQDIKKIILEYRSKKK